MAQIRTEAEIAEDLLDWTENHAQPPNEWLSFYTAKVELGLSDADDEALYSALEELERQGFIRVRGAGWEYTRKSRAPACLAARG